MTSVIQTFMFPSARGFGKLLGIVMPLQHILECVPFCLSLHLCLCVCIQLEKRLVACGRLQRSKPPPSAVAAWLLSAVWTDCLSLSCCWRRLIFSQWHVLEFTSLHFHEWKMSLAFFLLFVFLYRPSNGCYTMQALICNVIISH